MKTLLLLVILATTVSFVPVDSFCPHPFWPIMNECFYAVHQRQVTWQKARELCQAMGGDLAEPRRPVALTLFLKDQGYDTNLAMGGFKPSNREWTWLSGLSMTNFTEWSDAEPTRPNGDAKEGCLHYWPEGSIPFIADYDCKSQYGFVCQYVF